MGCYGREFAFYAGLEGLSAVDVLSWGTRNAGELLVDAPAAVGVVRAGAFADLIVVDGDPLEDPAILAQPQKYLKAVMRGGDFVINRLGEKPDRTL